MCPGWCWPESPGAATAGRLPRRRINDARVPSSYPGRRIVASVLTAGFSAKRLDAFFSDQGNHCETSERIGPPPVQPRIEPETRKQDRREKRADRGLACFGFEGSTVELIGDPSLEMNQDRHDDKRERRDEDSDSARGWCLSVDERFDRVD